MVALKLEKKDIEFFKYFSIYVENWKYKYGDGSHFEILSEHSFEPCTN